MVRLPDPQENLPGKGTNEFHFQSLISPLPSRLKNRREETMSVHQMNSQEIYEAYVAEIAPATLLDQGRDAIANRLMLQEQMPEKAAFYAADQILVYAQRVEDGEPIEPAPDQDSGEYR
jgi:hypothetical protein